ncbi:MAG TPA: glycosyltransferase [Bacteroidales bacterium]|nr:glycosyltransferase [Bacteroidales bacterium]
MTDLKEKPVLLALILSLEGGGAERIFTRVLKSLSDRFSIVAVVFYPRGRYLDGILSIPDIRFYSLEGERGNTISFVRRLRTIIKKENPSRVLSFLYYPNIVAYLSLFRLKTPLVLSERSNHRLYLGSSLKHRLWKGMLAGAYRKAFRIVTVSEGVRKFIADDFRINPSKIEVIYNGIDFETLDRLKEEPVNDFGFKKELKYILAVGSLVRAKNYPLLIDCFRIIAGRHNDIRLIILGSGTLEEDLKKMVKDFKLEDFVTFMGYVENPYRFMASATCYVLSSDWEGFPNSLLEAMYVNGHVVSTDCPTGPSEIISDGTDGLLCEPGNPVQLADAIEKMCYDEEFRKKVYANSRKKILNFGEEKMIARYRELLTK